MHGGLANGEHTFRVRASVPAGNLDDTPASRIWTIESEAIAPQVSAPASSIQRSTLGTSTIPLHLTWVGATDASGIASYELQQSVNGGAYSNVALATPTSLDATVSLAPGTSSYRFRLRAFDPAGNASDWAVGPPVRLGLTQENGVGLAHTGTWKRTALSGASGGYVKHAPATSARVQHTFTGTGYAIAMTTGPGRGKAAVYLDGALVETLDLYSSTVRPRRILYAVTFDAGATHTIEVRVLGTKNPSSSGTRVDMDAVVVMQ